MKDIMFPLLELNSILVVVALICMASCNTVTTINTVALYRDDAIIDQWNLQTSQL